MNKTFRYLLFFLLIPLLSTGEVTALTLRVADVQEENYPTVQALKRVGELLSERSGGRLSLEVFHSRHLGEEKDSIEQCQAGGLEMVRTNLAPLIDAVPEAGVPALPYIFRSEDHLHRVLDGLVGWQILDALGKTGLIGLCFYDSGARSFYNARKPLRSVEDFKGLRIRVQQTELFKAMVEALGAIPIPMPYGEIQNALRAGIIDGAENNWPSYHSTGHYTVAPYYTVDAHSMTPEVLVFSAKVWAGLSREDRSLIQQAASDSVPYMRELWREREAKARRAVEEAGVKTVEILDKEQFIKAMRPVYERFVTTDSIRDMVRRIQETP
jgi:tripartite ATP-independent transporter DctP family solute receptor